MRQISFEEDLIVIFRVDYRLEYHNLKQERSQNSLSLEEIQVLSRNATLGKKFCQALWLPFLVFNNTEDNEATKPSEDTELTITR